MTPERKAFLLRVLLSELDLVAHELEQGRQTDDTTEKLIRKGAAIASLGDEYIQSMQDANGNGNPPKKEET